MADEAGFRVDGVFYPFPDRFTIGDSVLVKMVAGLDMEDFGEALAEGEVASDPRALVAMVGVAIWHKNPRWGLEKATRFVQQIDMEKLAFEGTDEPAEEDDQVDPSSPEPTESESPENENDEGQTSGEPSSSAVSELNGQQDSGSVTPIPSPSGFPRSPTISVGSDPGN